MGFRRKQAEATASPPAKSSGNVKDGSTASSGKKEYHNNVMTILESKEGALYLQINPKVVDTIELTINGKKVTGMISKDPMVELEESVEAGRLTEERAQEIADKIPEFIKANVTLVTGG